MGPDLLRDQFFDFNLAHFREKLWAGHSIEIGTNLKGETQAFFAGRPIGLTDIGSTQFLNLTAA